MNQVTVLKAKKGEKAEGASNKKFYDYYSKLLEDTYGKSEVARKEAEGEKKGAARKSKYLNINDQNFAEKKLKEQLHKMVSDTKGAPTATLPPAPPAPPQANE